MVTAENDYKESDESSEVSATPSATGTAPSTPANVTATAGDSEVTISWDAVSGATSYNIYWSTSSEVSNATYEGKIENITSTTYTHTDLTNGTTYYYVVTAGNDYGESDESTEINATPSATGTAPSAPTNVAATAGDTQVTISWSTVSEATSYNIYWSTGSGVTADTGTKISGITTTSYTHAGRTNGTAYYYVVTAENDYGESDESGEVSATPSASGSAPSAPTNVSATAGDAQVTISWNSVTDATSYNIYWSTSTGVTKGAGTKISNVTSPYTHTGRTNGTTYYYVVTAENSYGESDESSEVSATPSGTDSRLPDTGQTTSYTSTFGEDSDYTINPPSYTDNGDSTITDNVTNLMWQKEDDNTTRSWTDANTYCNDLTLTSFSDWRLPSEYDLMSIVDYGTYDPSIDVTYFPNTNVSDYWSSTNYASSSSYAWHIRFLIGDVGALNKSGSYYVRCVRGQELNYSNFTDNTDGTVTEGNTGLMWQQGEGGQKTWEDAISYCEGLSLAGHTDWRLPNIKELKSITGDSVYSPAIDTNFFPGTNALDYWSSTTIANDSSSAWSVHFNHGNVRYYPNKSDFSYVRCVRTGQ